MLAVLAATAAVVTAAAPAQPMPVLSSKRIGSITADCRSAGRVTLTFAVGWFVPGETVTARVGHRRIRREIYENRKLRITVPVLKRRLPRGRFWFVTPVVHWRVFQSHEPDETRARAKVQVEDAYGCLPVVADLHLRTKPH